MGQLANKIFGLSVKKTFFSSFIFKKQSLTTKSILI